MSNASGFAPIPAECETVAHSVIGAAIEVHRALGPGFLERIYLDALCIECQFRSIIVGGVMIVELKAVPRVDPIHEARVISYLRTTGLRLGLLMNFNSKVLKDGINRIVV